MKSEILLSTGISCLEREKYYDALNNFELVLIEDPGNPDALFGRGMSHIGLGNNKDGIIDIHKASEEGSLAAKEFLRKTGRHSSESNTDILKYDGVKGWLAIFCGLVILSNSLDFLRALNTLHGLLLLVSLVISIWGILTGVFLIKKTPYCVTNAKIIISVMIIFGMYTVVYGQRLDNKEAVMQVLLYAAWFAYFFISKRVKVTYRNLNVL